MAPLTQNIDQLTIIQRLIRLWKYSRRKVGYCCFCGILCVDRSEIRTVDAKNNPTSYNCEDCANERKMRR